MAVMKRQDKNDDSGGNEMEARGETRLQKKENTPKKLTAKTDKKPLVVKKEKVNRLEQAKKYLRGVFNELKKVHWPNRREIITYTSVVVVAVIVVGILIWIFDSLLSRVLQLIIR